MPSAVDVDRYKWRAFAAIAVALVTIVMSMSMTFVALSGISEEFGVTLRSVSWVVIAQALTVTALMIPMGRLADLTGRRRVHLVGLALFGIGSLLAAASPTLGILVAAQVVTAVGNAMVQSVGAAIIVSVFPPEERGTAIGAQTTAVAIGAATGPIVAGVVLEFTSWRALFVIVTVPATLAFVAAWRLLSEQRLDFGDERPPRFDWSGASILAVAVTALVITVNNPFGLALVSPLLIGGLLVGVLGLAGFLRWERRAPSPMLELRLFRNRLLSLALATRLLGFMANTVTRLLLPIFLISFRELSEGRAGLLLFADAVGLGLASNICGRLADTYGERRFVTGGLAALLVTGLMLMSVDRATSLMVVAAVAFANGVAQGVWSVPNNSVIMGSVPGESLGVAGALTGLTRNVANVIGQAAASAVVAAVMIAQGFDIALDEIPETPGAASAFLDGWRIAYVLVTLFAATALVVSWYCRPSEDDAGSEPAAPGRRIGTSAHPPR